MTRFGLRISTVWLVLAGATIASWWLAVTRSADDHETTTLLFVLAFGKVALVMSEFMDVRTAPWPLRVICLGWITIVFCGIMFLYRYAPGAIG